MIIAAAMSRDDDNDEHDHDMVMPGFRFHPTEEELIEFYLRRKVEGKRFNVELISFLDLYRYDPWELPALAAIGEKEWFFYVPRDRKYRNGDRPNRVTTSGYWKATGADRMIRTESFRSIGLKKTLVFYSGKAPKGIRTSWIMNEYRLPQHETDRYQKGEISLCRVYKRAGVEDHSPLPRSISSGSSSSRGIQSDKKQRKTDHRAIRGFKALGGHSLPFDIEKLKEADGSSSTDIGTALGLCKHMTYSEIAPIHSTLALTPVEEDRMLQRHSNQVGSLLPTCTTLFACSSSVPVNAVDHDLHRLVDYKHFYTHQQQQHNHPHHPTQYTPLPPQSQSLALNTQPSSLPAFPDKLWEWNPISEANRDYTSPFK
ncbi:hypothetical protein HHK36_007701 [Tetracentron sinense]|uniref:NAC domain-containing protein n=1 Tax=Tetracentron sinense TaxID=13715 RepID=A0A834ZF21_TETSI|nr:hypothetical protein HHK36_007701 [Tetracentron sinense]